MPGGKMFRHSPDISLVYYGITFPLLRKETSRSTSASSVSLPGRPFETSCCFGRKLNRRDFVRVI